MKKIIYLLCISASMMFTSCFEDVDNWYSETFDYSGRFVYGLYLEDEEIVSIEEGNEIYIYNSAANISNEIWIEDVFDVFPFKGKFKLTGDASNFKGGKTENVKGPLYFFNGARYVAFTPTAALAYLKPTAEGQHLDGYQDYADVIVEEGKIIPKGATTIGGNVSDSIYFKITLQGAEAQFVSYKTDSKAWADPNVPEYSWKHDYKLNVPDPEAIESYIVKGYRYTGFPEDH
jgi:hypothetical protein